MAVVHVLEGCFLLFLFTATEKITGDCIGCYNKFDNGTSYYGTASTNTILHWDGIKECLNWNDVNSPYITYRADNNFCHNPDVTQFSQPWCYTNKDTFEYQKCDIPICNDCRRSRIDYNYNGKINITKSGKPCKYWSTAGDIRYQKLEKNYCRAPSFDSDSIGGPWCYITDPFNPLKRWERCNVPLCNSTQCPPLSGTNMNDLQGPYTHPDCVTVTCKNGYESVSKDPVTCRVDGTWSGTPQCIGKLCHSLNVSHMIAHQGEVRYPANIPVLCENGYISDSPDPVFCTANGTWSRVPTCTGILCPSLHVTNMNDLQRQYRYPETYNVSCKEGYESDSSDPVKCTANGTWSRTPTCRGIPCPSLHVTNMNDLQRQYRYPETYNVSCKEGYESDSSDPVKCTANGTWSRTPTCRGKKCHSLNVSHMVAHHGEVRYPANISVLCENGYISDSPDSVLCTANGTWSRVPTCTGIPCPSLHVTNMNDLQRQYRYPETYTVSCKEGYESDSSDPVKCTANGTWSRTPTCRGILCKSIPEIDKALTTNLTYRFTDQVTIECEPGYRANTTEQIGCSTNGEWTKPLPICIKVPDSVDPSSQLGSAIGGAVGGASVMIAVVIIVVIIIHRRKNQRKNNETVSYNKPINNDNKAKNSAYDEICMKDEKDPNCKIGLSNKDENYYNIQTEEDSGGYYAFTEGPQMPKTAVLIDNFYDYVERRRNEGGEIETQFGTFKNGLQNPTTEGLRPGNKAKNKYRNLYAYDNTRVVLKKKTPSSPDYINASFINGYGKVKKYIAAQGPLGNTVDDFWEMVFQFDCGKIVMLTNVFEEGKEKCIVYWPETVGSSTTFGSVKLTLTREEIFSDLTIRTLMLHQEDKEKMIKQFHFTAWPDKDVPKYSSSLVHFRYKVNAYKSTLNGPTVVHCSAGIGRTGTYIALDYVVTEALAVGYVDVYGCVEGLRRQRVNMVQTAKQYVFLHEAVLEALMCPNSGIPSKDFPEAYKNLMKFDQEKKKHKLQVEYEIMNSLAQRHEEDSFDKGKMAENKPKNRYSNIIPVRSETPMLLTRVEGRNDYINAVFLPGYRSSRAFIITQMPLDDTKVDLWRLIHDYNISTVVMLNIEHDKRDAYWPEGTGGSVDIGPFRIEQTKFEEKQLYNVRHLTYQYKRTNEKTMTLVQQTFWKDRKACPDSVDDLVNLISGAEDVHGKSNSEGPMLIHCLNGCDKSGLYCVMATVIERLRIEQDIDIQHVIKQMRNRRPQIIPNYEQYQFVYDAVIDYLKEFETYSNFS